MDEMICIGEVTKIRGLKGEVKVYLWTDIPEQFSAQKSLTLRKTDFERNLKVAGIEYHPRFLFLKFKDVNSAEEASELVGAEIVIPKSKRMELPDDFYYFDMLEGFSVVSERGESIGILRDISHYPASDALVVSMGDTEIEIPFVKELVPKVDVESKVITIIDMPSLWTAE